MAGFKRLYELLQVNINDIIKKSDNKSVALDALIAEMNSEASDLESELNSGNKHYESNQAVYATANEQAAQLKVQLELLKAKLEEAKTAQSKYSCSENTDTYSQNSFCTCKQCNKSADILDAEFDRLMNDIRSNHNL